MKAVIIGGGIAGLTMGLLLKKRNWDVVVNEKSRGSVIGGHAFLMSSDGMSVLSDFFEGAKEPLKQVHVNLFSLMRPDGEELIKIKLDNWYCLKRVDLVSFLSQQFDEKSLVKGRSFSHFVYENDKAVSAVFDNGDIEYGDIFIGADGSHSKVREIVHGAVNFSPVEVKEIVGMSKNISETISDESLFFQKFQHKEKGLAFGYIPTSSDESVWFMQYDAKFAEGKESHDPDKLSSFCYEMLNDFPEIVKEILYNSDFSKAYIWNTRDFDILPRFHKQNIVLIGDAAHLALPFTSAGTTNAVLDALELAKSLENIRDYDEAFSNYYTKRSDSLKSHLEQGRELKKIFLSPNEFSERGFILPLVSETSANNQERVNKTIRITYFTDPVCSTCWLIQPVLRKLEIEYGEHVQINYHMGGLLPSWKDYNKGSIKNPLDAAKHWEEVSQLYKIPLDGDVWIEDPLDSSFPPSIAFKAAQLQDDDKAVYFLRRIKELVFIEKKNITRWDVIEKAALECGLDSVLLRKDMSGKAAESFINDLKMAANLNVNSFPTLIFSVAGQNKFTLKGFHSFDQIEKIIHQLIPEIGKPNRVHNAEDLFLRFNNMTIKELAFLCNNTEENSAKIVEQLFLGGKLRKLESKNGTIWVYDKRRKVI